MAKAKVGDEILVRSGFGNGPLHRGVVTAVLDDVKNGYPGYDYELEDGKGFWCYEDQVKDVIKKVAR